MENGLEEAVFYSIILFTKKIITNSNRIFHFNSSSFIGKLNKKRTPVNYKELGEGLFDFFYKTKIYSNS